MALQRTSSGHGPSRGKVLESADMSPAVDKLAENRAEKQHEFNTLMRSISGSVNVETEKHIEEYGDDEVYFGSVKAYLAPVPGSVIVYDHSKWKPLTDAESVERVLERAEKMGPKGDVIVPAIPALDFGPVEGAAEAKPDASQWPQFMGTALIKVGKNIPESMLKTLPGGPEKAFASGVRSCVLKIDGKWYRLKGSGNNDEGFVVKSELNSAGEFTRQIRGAAWLHTAARENFMAAHLASSMQPNGMLGANEAMGIYMYDAPNQPFGDKLSVPACIVQKTHGDRRLGTHVMAGIELILQMFVDGSAVTEEQCSSWFPAARKELNSAGDFVVSTAALMTDHMMAQEFAAIGMMEPGSFGLEFNIPRDGTSLAAGSSTPLPYKKLESGTYPLQWTHGGSKEMGSQWRSLWDRCVADYNTSLEKVGQKSVLGYLFSRLGNDCGRIMKGMHDAQVSWGTYQDEICIDPSQWHCNAHANNVVVLAEGSSQDMFLGYLDLDMAFDDATFVSVYGELHGKGTPKGTVGIRKEDHAVLLNREHVNFMEVLAGADSTSGVPMVAKEYLREQPNRKELDIVKAMLYDTLILGYLNAYKCDSSFPVATLDEELHKMAHIVIKMAIIVMADFIA